MTHNEECKCGNCQAKGKPIREVWLKSVTPEEITNVEVCDWLEGMGMVDSLAMQKYIRKYGFLMIRIKTEAEKKHGETTDHYNKIINGLNDEIRVQGNRLRKNLGIRDKFAKEINDLIIERCDLQEELEKLQERNDNQTETINSYRNGSELENLRHRLNELYIEKGKVQNELDKHTKYEGGVAAECGHPVQCLYAAAKVDGGPVCCSMCDMERQVAALKLKRQANKAAIQSLKNELIKSIEILFNKNLVIRHKEKETLRLEVEKSDKDKEIRVLKVANQRFADTQKELQREQMVNKGSLQTIHTLGAEVERLTKRDMLFIKKVAALKEQLEIMATNRDCIVESRDADWQRIKNLEAEIQNSAEVRGLEFTQIDLGQHKIQIENKELRAENEHYSDRVHSLEEENGRYFEQICRLEIVIDKLAKQIP